MDNNIYLDKVKEFFIWEENVSTEPEKNCLNNTRLDNGGITSNIEKKEMPIVCEDTVKIKKNVDVMNDLELLIDTINWLKSVFYKREWYQKNRQKRLEKNKEYYNKNKKVVLSQQKKYNLKNSEYIKTKKKKYRKLHIKQIHERNKIYSRNNKQKRNRYLLKNRERIKEQTKNYKIQRLKNDPNYKLECRLRRRLSKCVNKIKNKKEIDFDIKELGYSIEDCRKYIESNFHDGMTWKNHGYNGWHIHHIRPLSTFDLSIKEQFLESCNYINLFPVWIEEHKKIHKELGDSLLIE